MNNEQRIEIIKERLNRSFSPSHLDVTDDSHLHIGHAGAQTGRGHFTLSISATAFDDKRPLEQHRMIYQALGELMETDIHALVIQVV